MKGLIADIQRGSVHDGPGIRTTVFFKGCPLRCAWCHNPECISFAPQELFYPEKCIGCGKCKEGCFSGARVLCGRTATAEDVLNEVLEDAAYYGSEGGVTFSGGEPLAQPEFLAETAALCRERGISTAVETSMIEFYPEILQGMRWIMADLKLWDPALHRKYTGVGNERIRENLRAANALGVPMILRTPVIPEVNGRAEEIKAIAAFAWGLENVRKYELLPYHPLGNAKRRALGEAEPAFTVPSKALMEELNQYAFLR